MKVNPVSIIEREHWVAVSILRRVNYGVYICICSVISDEYKCKTKYEIFYDSHFKPLHQSKCCGGLIYNRYDSPICVT